MFSDLSNPGDWIGGAFWLDEGWQAMPKCMATIENKWIVSS